MTDKNTLDLARQWAADIDADRETLSQDTIDAAADLISSLPDAWVSVDDLPAPDRQGRWKVTAASFGSVTTSPAGEVVLDAGNFRDMQLYLTPGKALDLARTLEAAAAHVDETLGDTDD